jgi:imidazolonepropionase-like amidohydrolase
MTDHLIVTAARVVTGPGGQLLAPGAVLISGDTILAVGSPDSIAEITPRGARRLDHPTATILPGLIDSHVHLAFDASTRAVAAVQAATAPELLQQMAAHAEQALDQGITTVRDLGDRDYLAISLRDQITSGSVVGPHILSAGAPLTTRDGRCWFLGGEVSNADQIRAVIGRHAAGADCITVMLSGGRLTAGTEMWKSQFPPGLLAVIVAEAARVGLPVAAHAHGTASIIEAAEAGVSTIEHCSWMTTSTAWAAAIPRPDVVQLIADRASPCAPRSCPVGVRVIR